MRRTMLRVLAVAVVSILPLTGLPAWAQEASPPSEGAMEMPPGAALAMLALLAPVELPADPAALVVARLTLEPGTEIPPHPHSALEIALIEAGSVTLRTVEGPPALGIRAAAAGPAATPEAAGPGTELTGNAGDIAIIPVGNVLDVRAGDEGATILVFELTSQDGAATPAA
jgi:quercetin dioxygenase-like cupin family protein